MKPVVAICLAFAAVMFAGCNRQKAELNPSAPRVEGDRLMMPDTNSTVTSVSVRPVTKATVAALHFTGRLTWDDDVTVRVFSPFAGRVTRILVEPGQSVDRRAPLALVASPDFGQVQSEGRRAETDFLLAERALNRERDLFEHGAVARKDLESAEADFARARAERERTQSRLELFGGNTDAVDQIFPLQSPLAGVVVERNVTPGQEVRPDQLLANAPQFVLPLFVVTDPSRLWVQLDVTETEMRQIHAGQEITVRSQALPDQTFTGRLDSVSESLDPTTRRVKARGWVDNTQRLLKAEMFVTVELPAMESSDVQVPSNAVFLLGDRHYLFVEEQPGTYRRREVKVGGERSSTVVVREGLRAGDRVVCEGSLLLEQVFQTASGS